MIAQAPFLSSTADVEEAFVRAGRPPEPPRGLPRPGRPDEADAMVTTASLRLMKESRRA